MPVKIGAALLRPRVIGCVLVVKCSGLLTAHTVRDMRRWLAGAVPAECCAVVMDYRACAIALSDDELTALASPSLPLSPPMPLAWVVRDEQTAELWRRQVLRLAFAGQRRFVSRLFEAAFAWATEQARLAQAAGQR